MTERPRLRRRDAARDGPHALEAAPDRHADRDGSEPTGKGRDDEHAPAQSDVPRVPHVQHSFSRVTVLQPTPPLAVSDPADATEQEAEQVADAVTGAEQSSPDQARVHKSPGRATAGPAARTVSGAAGADPRDDDDPGPEVASALRSGGAPLDSETRSYFEPRFGHDFGAIRVHTDARAAESAKSMSAQAYAVGQDIVFGAGRYSPGTPEGRHLLAHELTHTIQQASGGLAVARRFENDPPRSAHDVITIDLAKASEAEKLAEIQRLFGDGTSEGKRAISLVWNSFGDVLTVARANPGIFEKSCQLVPSICDHGAFTQIRQEFKAAVEGRVQANLEANRNYVMAEMSKLGIGPSDPAAAPTAEQDRAIADTQKLAEQASKAQKAMALLQTVPVGTSLRVYAVAGGGLPPQRVKEYYSPHGTPASPGFQPETGEGFRPWGEVDKEYKTADAALQKILSVNPAVYALISSEGNPNFKQVGEKSGAVAAAKPEDARKAIKPAMEAVIRKIEEVVPKVGGELDYRDFIPVHDQLMGGPKFGGAVEKQVIKHDVEGHETGKMLRSLGLGALSAAAFVLAEFATAGMATFLLVAAGVAAGAANATLSVEDYLTKRELAQASSGNKALDIISKEQVDSALFAAVIDTVFVFLDGVGAIAGGLSKSARVAATLVEAAEEGSARAAAKAVGEAVAQGGPAATSAIERSVAEVGVKGTMQATGKTADQLAEIVGRESPLGQRISAAAELAGKAGGKEVEALAEKLTKLATLEKGEMEQVVRASIDQFGTMGTVRKAGGWKALTKPLGEGAPVSRTLMEWRESLVRDLEGWIAKESRGASSTVQTGTQKSAVSDIDISTFGEDAAQNVKRSREFVAGRAGCRSDELERLLDLDIFADPSRMHLQDVTKGLSADTRREISRSAAKYEEQLVFGRRLHDARQSGNEALIADVRKQAESLGITPFEGYKPLSKAEVEAATSRLDGLAKKLETAAEADRKKIIEEMGQTQGQILAEGGGGYATGGGVRLNVTERPMDLGRMPKVLTPRWPEVRYTAILAEGPHMDAAIGKLALEGQSPEHYAGALKNIGKHGNRIAEILGADVAKAPANLGQLAEDLLRWVERAKDPDFVKSAANVQQLARMREEIAAQLAQLRSASDSGLKALRQEAELGTAMAPEQMAQIQSWTQQNAKLSALANRIDAITPAIFEGVHAGVTTLATGMEDDERQQSVPGAPVSGGAPALQPKLAVSVPGDRYEQEADAVAERVTRGEPVPAIAAPTGVSTQVSTRDGSHTDDSPAVEVVSDAAAVARGVGAPLDAETRSSMETSFRFDFSRVRIHSDSRAAEAASSLNARAYTFGSQVVFGAGQYAPETTAGRGLLAHELTHVVQQSGGSKDVGAAGDPEVLARAVDPSKAEPIRAELDSTFYVNNSTLEKLWASLGVDLIEAVNDTRPLTSDTGKNKRKESYRDLWWRSTLEQNIDLTAAARPILNAFATDSMDLARSRLQSQQQKLEALQQELKNAADQKKQIASPAANRSTSPEDPTMGMTKDTSEKPMTSARGLVDTATFVHFLQNWEDILRGAVVGTRRVDTSNLLPQPASTTPGQPFAPLPNAPAPAAGMPDASIQPVRFDPTITVEQLLASPNIDSVDTEAFDTLKRTYRQCSEKRAAFHETVAAMLAEDANLAVLSERKMLGQVSALGGRTDDEAALAIDMAAKQNAETIKTFLGLLNTPGGVDWKALRPIHAQLLSGGGGRRDWSELVARTFVEGYFKREAEAEREAAEAQLKLNLVVGGLAFIAMLSPAAPLAAAVLAATQVYAAGSLVGAIAQSSAADKRADAASAGAAAGVVNDDDARRAKERAEARQVSLLEILLTALPFLPLAAKGGARVIGALGRQARWSQIAQEAQAANVASAEAGMAPTASIRPRATIQQLREMIANSGEYYTWRTGNGDVAANRTLQFTGETNALAPEGLYLARGVKGLPYGNYAVSIRGANYPIRGRPLRAEEFIMQQELPAHEGVWYTAEDYAAAKGLTKKP